MKKWYEKNELLFAIVWIVVYCVVSIPIRGALGDESIIMLAGLSAIAAGILAFVKGFHLEEKYGLVKWNKSAKEYLFFLPMLVLMTGNLWGGMESLLQVLFAIAWGFLFTFVFYKSGSLLVCIAVHGMVDAFSKFAAHEGNSEYVYTIATILVSAAYCIYLSRKPTALKQEEAK